MVLDKNPAPLRTFIHILAVKTKVSDLEMSKKKNLEKKDPFGGNGSELVPQHGRTCREVIHVRVGGIRLSFLLSLSFRFHLKGVFKNQNY